MTFILLTSIGLINVQNVYCSKTLKAFREGEIQVLVSSDVMTRGMDVEGVRNVINFDMPPYIKTYIHRVGRTARAGQTGRCFTLLSKVEVHHSSHLLVILNLCSAFFFMPVPRPKVFL